MNADFKPLPWYVGLLPVFAVLISLYVFSNAYLAVAIYHAGIILLLCTRKTDLPVFKGFDWKWALGFSFCCALALPVIVLLWPLMHLPGMTFAGLLENWGMNDLPIVLFCFYSILIHPALEEAFWRGLMRPNLLSDGLFALFHVFVLVKVLHWPFAILCFVCLAVAAFAWRWVAEKTGGLLIPIISHAVADLGVLLAVWYLL